MIALIVSIGDEVLEAYEFRLLDIMEASDADRELRREVRMLEKERDWKRVVRILTDGVASLEMDELEMDEEVGPDEG